MVSVAMVLGVAALTGVTTQAYALKSCGSFAHHGDRVGVNATHVSCRVARRVARARVAGRSTHGFHCRRGPNQGTVPTYTCKRGERRVYIYNAGYGE